MSMQLTISPSLNPAIISTAGRTSSATAPRVVRTNPFGRPTWRGRMHTWACVAAVPCGVVLAVQASDSTGRMAAIVYATTLVLLFGTSASYHRLTKCERSRAIMQRLDHSMIFLLIVGTYTPLCLVALPAHEGRPFLAVVASVAVVGIILKIFAFERARWLSWSLYPILGWASLFVAPSLIRNLTGGQLVLMAAGGLAYSVGLPVLLAKRPNPWPDRFGYHEVWHVLTIVAAGLHFIAIQDVLV